MEKTSTQSELEAIAQALADTSDGLTGSEIGHILASLKMVDPTPEMTKWKRLHNAFVERQNFSGNRRAILQFIREAMKPERYARQAERFEPLRANLNRALAFVGMAVKVDGTLHVQFYGVKFRTVVGEVVCRFHSSGIEGGLPIVRTAIHSGKHVYIFANNHYAGYGPATVEYFQELWQTTNG